MAGPQDQEPAAVPPDLRFVLANERTFLAWNRTALALVAAGLAAGQLLDRVALPGGRELLALLLVGLGGVVAVMSYRRWREVEKALTQGVPPSKPALPHILAATLIGVALLCFIILLSGAR